MGALQGKSQSLVPIQKFKVQLRPPAANLGQSTSSIFFILPSTSITGRHPHIQILFLSKGGVSSCISWRSQRGAHLQRVKKNPPEAARHNITIVLGRRTQWRPTTFRLQELLQVFQRLQKLLQATSGLL